jgi:hypothetical protein
LLKYDSHLLAMCTQCHTIVAEFESKN